MRLFLVQVSWFFLWLIIIPLLEIIGHFKLNYLNVSALDMIMQQNTNHLDLKTGICFNVI